MNSGLQCLFNNSNLTKFFLENYKYDNCLPETLCGQFASLVKKVWSGSGSLSPSEFKKVLGLSFAQFLDYRQVRKSIFLNIEFLFLDLNFFSTIVRNFWQFY